MSPLKLWFITAFTAMGFAAGGVLHTGSYDKAADGIYFSTSGMIMLALIISLNRRTK